MNQKVEDARGEEDFEEGMTSDRNCSYFQTKIIGRTNSKEPGNLGEVARKN